MSAVSKRLQQAYDQAAVIPFDPSSRFVIMSDCHRGQGNAGDNFLPAQNLFFGALEYYYDKGFTYIELGDGDELWENRRMGSIIEIHNEAFGMMSKFYKENRFYMLYGNHDMVKGRNSFSRKHCRGYRCPVSGYDLPLFPGIQIPESLILEDRESRRLFLVHGHQGSLINDRLWLLGRFLVRYFWRPLELVGFLAPTGAGRPHKKKDRIEKELAGFAKDKKQIMIAGHTHRPAFPQPGEGYYFNDGSCVHPRCITAIEIENGDITLVKWLVSTRPDRTLFVDRQVLSGPVSIAAYFGQ
ncbi:MAG: serine/threonine protein phosphatase [Clostridiales bacterium]|nr:serine/threonine protein phosphatase [Clostridiales bacterium]